MSAVLNVARPLAPESRPQPAQRESEFAFAATDFERVRRLMFQRAGISLGAGKQAMVYSRLSRRLRGPGTSLSAAYLRWLEHASGLAAALSGANSSSA